MFTGENGRTQAWKEDPAKSLVMYVCCNPLAIVVEACPLRPNLAHLLTSHLRRVFKGISGGGQGSGHQKGITC